MIERMELKVIVKVNSINDATTTSQKYDRLFATAYQALFDKNPDLIRVDCRHDDKAFHSIDEYFAHLSDLYAIDPVYIMLPLDETPFAIDADKRTISNPKITVLQNDQNAEVVLFTIDRYFDYKDLDTVEYTYVQWTLPDGTEGASKITMKDLSIPGKLRLGWPLDNEITSQKGTVKFSVRFFDTDTIVDEKTKESKTVVVYSFNTLTSTLNISESLQPQINEGASVNDPIGEGFFRKAIVNSQLRTENSAIPLGPRFEEPGRNLNQYESLVAVLGEDKQPTGEDTLKLVAQAVVSDTGVLTYEWWYKPAEDGTNVNGKNFNSDTWYCFEDYVVDENTTLPGFKAYGGTVAEEYEAFTYDAKVGTQIGQRYYKDNKGTAAGTEDFVDGATLYTRYTTYTVPASGPVTGQYIVKATSTIGPNSTRPQPSTTCYLVSPADITFKRGGDLNAKEIFPVDKDNKDLAKKLTVNPSDDTTLNAQRTFTWNRYIIEPQYNENGELTTQPNSSIAKPASSGEGENIVYGNVHEVTAPGWYQVVVSSTLNRETKTAPSTMCKLTSKPQVPTKNGDNPSLAADATLSMQFGATSGGSGIYQANDKVAYYNPALGEVVTLDVKCVVRTPACTYEYDAVNNDWTNPTVIDATKEALDPELFSEGLSFAWGYSTPDSPFKYLTASDVGDGKIVESGLGTPALKVRCVEDGKIYTYRCIVTNTLNGESVACEPSKALVFEVR